MKSGKLLLLLIFTTTALLAATLAPYTPGYALELDGFFTHWDVEQPLERSNWVPNNGERKSPEQQPLGDMWTFNCKKGDTVTARVDTRDDLDTRMSCLDPVLELFSPKGEFITSEDDNVDCSIPQTCGFACPAIKHVCEKQGEFWLVVRDFGFAPEGACGKGGGYDLTVTVVDRRGRDVKPSKVKLGGGPFRRVPKAAVQLGKAPRGPALDDEDVPSYIALPRREREALGLDMSIIDRKGQQE